MSNSAVEVNMIFFVNICQWEMNFLLLFSLTEGVLRVCLSDCAVRVDR